MILCRTQLNYIFNLVVHPMVDRYSSFKFKEPIYDIDISYKDTIHHLMLSSYNFWHLIHTFVLEVPF